MAASNSTDVVTASKTSSVTLPVQTATTLANSEERGNLRTEISSSSVYPFRLSSNIPDIPEIPSPLLRPPTAGQKTAVAVSTESNAHASFPSSAVTSNNHGRLNEPFQV